MGIRFYCSQCGHKLNVKAFQAGRRGLCPYCGGGIQIPTESTRPSSKQSRDQPDNPPAHDPGDGAARPAPPQAQGPAVAPSGMGEAMGANQPVLPLAEPPGAGGAPATFPTPLTAPSPGQPTGAVPAQPAAEAPAYPAGQTPATPVGQGPAAAAVQPVAFPSRIESPAGSYASDTAVPSGVDFPPTASAPPVTPSEPPPAAGGVVDPLAEAPDAVWYVRPPGGGQFGPAPSSVMQGWIAEGRVSPDSLVWREGWRDWQQASESFPQLGPGEAEPGLGAIATSDTALSRAAASGYRLHTRRRSAAMNAAIITILVLAVILLFGVFMWVLNGGPGRLGARSTGAPVMAAWAIDRQAVGSSFPAS